MAVRSPDTLDVIVHLVGDESGTGALVAVPRGGFAFGGDLDDDLVVPVLGPGRWGEVQADKRGARLVAARSGLVVAGKPVITGEPRPLVLPAVIEAAGARILVPAPPSAGLRALLPGAALVALAVVLVGSLVLGPSGAPAGVPLPSIATAPAPTPGAVPPPAPSSVPAPTPVADLDVNRLARSVDLSSPVTTRRERGEIVVAGSLTEVERSRLADAVSAARAARPGAPAVRLESPDPPFARHVAGVMLSPKRYLVGRDGRRYAPGDSLPDGSRVERIEDERVVVSREGLLDTMELPK